MPVAAARAGLFAVLGTSVSVTVHHLAFGSGPPWAAHVLAALLLFAAALPGAGHDKPLRRQVLLALGSQAAIGLWLVATDDQVSVPVHTRAPAAMHAVWPVVAAHVVLTVLCAVMLHGADAGRRGILVAAGRQWQALRALLRCLSGPVRTPLDLTALGAVWRTSPGPGRAPPTRTVLVGTVVRRGPPLVPPPLVG
ncbi:hypothetical protein ACIRF8_12130 [Streptomyces sp. NPDC102406]|uniref:hypothetical protein n=1 Tax=Streptomyces sp. NPDC102406 TaxID=3366171 RepID=UPI003810A062